MYGSTMRCNKCNQYKPDRCTCGKEATPNYFAALETPRPMSHEEAQAFFATPPADAQRIAQAQAKRERKQAKRLVCAVAARSPQPAETVVRGLTTFEVRAKGYDDTGDETDHLIFWVNAPSVDLIKQAIEGTGAGFYDTILVEGDEDISFWLPRQMAELRTALGAS